MQVVNVYRMEIEVYDTCYRCVRVRSSHVRHNRRSSFGIAGNIRQGRSIISQRGW